MNINFQFSLNNLLNAFIKFIDAFKLNSLFDLLKENFDILSLSGCVLSLLILKYKLNKSDKKKKYTKVKDLKTGKIEFLEGKVTTTKIYKK